MRTSEQCLWCLLLFFLTLMIIVNTALISYYKDDAYSAEAFFIVLSSILIAIAGQLDYIRNEERRDSLSEEIESV